jgi:hypothetical protein
MSNLLHYRPFFALADNHGVLPGGLQREDEELEELFHRGARPCSRCGLQHK